MTDKQYQNLETTIINESKYSKILSTIKKEAKAYFTDTSAALLFNNPVFAITEFFVGGLEPPEILKTRLSMSIFGLFISRPYGKFREYWAKLLKTDPNSSRIRKFFTDVSGNIIFYSPIYVFSMYLADASLEEMAMALPTGITLSTILGRPYGIFLDKWRKRFGVKPTLESYVEKTNIES